MATKFKNCSCGCNKPYARYYKDGKYYMNISHYKKGKEKSKEDNNKNKWR